MTSLNSSSMNYISKSKMNHATQQSTNHLSMELNLNYNFYSNQPIQMLYPLVYHTYIPYC